MKIFNVPENLNNILDIFKHRKIVFTSGCFDIIHSAHVELFKFAKSQGDILIVGVNNDDSIKRLKGNNKPMLLLKDRLKILEAISYIDFLIAFEEDTPLNLIQKLTNINILIKGENH